MTFVPAPTRPGRAGRHAVAVTLITAALVGAGLAGVTLARRDEPAAPRWGQPSVAGTAPAEPSAAASRPAAAADTITLSATGDIIMGGAPRRLPPRGGAGFFDDVRSALSADLVMGNLEQPLTDDTGVTKCVRQAPPATPGGPPTRTAIPNCHAFRVPPAWAAHLKDAGFQLLNTANNHSRDFGLAGYRNTRAALERQGLRHTGATDQITLVEVRGVRVAVLGFSSYQGTNNVNDLTRARDVVRRAAAQANLVVVQVHMGAEGAARNHVRPGSEIYLGENRGDPMKFARTVIDAGADLVVGHGPHVLRGMEFYNDRLIAYSLGNFAGGGRTLRNTGALGYGGVLTVSLRRDGSFVTGRFRSTALTAAGRPVRDKRERGRVLVARLSTADFGPSAAVVDGDGTISPPS